MNPDASTFVAGHRGLAGSTIVRRSRVAGFQILPLGDGNVPNLTREQAVERFLAGTRQEFMSLAAVKAGGILASYSPSAQFLRDNVAIQTNVIDAAYPSRARKLLFLGSSCHLAKRGSTAHAGDVRCAH